MSGLEKQQSQQYYSFMVEFPIEFIIYSINDTIPSLRYSYDVYGTST